MKKIFINGLDKVIINQEQMSYYTFSNLVLARDKKYYAVTKDKNDRIILHYNGESYEVEFDNGINYALKKSILDHVIEKKIQFTDWNTVIINEKEMSIDKFFKVMDGNIENDDYDVTYYEEDNTFIIYFKGLAYEVVFSNEIMENINKGDLTPVIRHLLALSRIQKMVDITSGRKDLAISDVLDDDAKALYLQKLKRQNTFSLKKYFENIKDDFFDSLDNMKNALIERWDEPGLFWYPIFIPGAIIGVVLPFIFGNITDENSNLLLLYASIGAITPYTAFPIVFSFYQIKSRLKRLSERIKNKKLNTYKIKHLNSMVMNDEKKNQIIEVEGKVIDNDNQVILLNEIPKIIDRLLNLLKKVDVRNRGNLSNELRSIILDYQKVSLDKSKTDSEISYLNQHLIGRIVDIELRIGEALKQNREANRSTEIDYLLEKVDELDSEEKGRAYQKKIK